MLHGRGTVNDLLATVADQRDDLSSFFDYCRFAFNEQDDTAIQYFVSSFSELHDDAELWDRYGCSGAGVAITFDTHRMGADPAEPFIYYIARVTYTPEEQSRLLLPLIEGARTVLKEYILRHGYDVRDVAIQFAAAKLCSHLNHHSISLKSETWSVEREWRTVFSILQNDPEERKTRVNLRPDGRPCVDVSIRSVEPEEVRMPIVRVAIGATADDRAVRSILNEYGYQDIEVKHSACSE